MASLALTVLCYAAFCLFLIGASHSYRSGGSVSSVVLMALAVLADAVCRLLLVAGIAGPSAVPASGTLYVSFLVWFLSACALLALKSGKTGFFHSLVTIIELCWFIAIALHFYGAHTVPA